MIYKIYPAKDASLYEKTESLNTGLDAIIEVSKTLESVLDANNVPTSRVYASRGILQFNYSDLDPLIALGFNTSSGSYNLKLYATEIKQLPVTYKLEINTVSGSWNMGLGRYEYLPILTNGVSWKYRTDSSTGTTWLTSSFVAGSTGSWNVSSSGGNWYTNSSLIVTKSYNYNESNDIDIDISSIVRSHLSGSIPNDGIIIRREQAEEYVITDESNLQFFSSDTNTIYLPHLLVKWNDFSFTTGSLTSINSNVENVVYFKNLREKYKVGDRVKFRLVARPKYPTRTFSTSSAYATEYYLPASSSYSIEDLHTKDAVIPNDDIYTRISCDSSGSYFNFMMSALQPERWYKFLIKITHSTSNIEFYDSGFIFKLER